MILILSVTAAVFLTGVVLGVLAMVVIGIQAEERRSRHMGPRATTLAGTASRRLGLASVRVADTADADNRQAGR
jgi:hypothetical protein